MHWKRGSKERRVSLIELSPSLSFHPEPGSSEMIWINPRFLKTPLSAGPHI
jgi:hypothetical protein